MHFKSSLAAGASLGVILALGVSAGAQAKTTSRHHHHKQPSAAAVAAAQTADEIQALKAEVEQLKSQLDAETAARQETQAQAQAASAQAAQAQAQVQAAQAQLDDQIKTIPTQVNTEVQAAVPKAGPVKVTLGGFAAAETVYRSRQNVSDIGSNFSKIPYANSPLHNLDESRFTARQSRISLLAQADINPTTHAAFYGEFDFLGAAQTANSNESNSYNLRIRHMYGTLDWDDLGMHLLAGQTWSMVTMNGHGITPRAEDIPLTIDAQYSAGFVWARQPQIRLVKDFDKQLWFGLSIENPQTTFAGSLSGVGSTATGVSAVTTNAGIGLLANVNNFSFNHAPDVVGKVAYEPMIGDAQPLHLEVFGLYRNYYDRVAYAAGNALGVPTGATNISTNGGGVGGGVTWTVVPKMLDLQGSVLTGRGIGRYGSGQLPDVILADNGRLQPIPETMFLVGGTLHATPGLDVYGLYGQERDKTAALTSIGSTFFGYGNPNATLANCFVEGASCSPDTQQIRQVNVGFWDKLYTGKFGSVRFGVQYSHTWLDAFPGASGLQPKTDDDMVFTSFRIYPNF